jgi:DNA (cytosine-5)-methyltransferase 1
MTDELMPWRIVGPWTLPLIKRIKRNGLKVFSCFHCGGGSTMGYKLAGYEVLGGVEIDKDMMAIYRANHKPVHSYLMGVQDFLKVPTDDLPPALLDLDILDGSPPCSSFSTVGRRHKKWGKKTYFREGQAAQVLDDLFFDFIEIANRLRPKVVIAENVKGMIQGKARGYCKEVLRQFREAGYRPQLFLLNASRMGVPQRRERVFFVASRDDLDMDKLVLRFDEPPIPFSDIDGGDSVKGSAPVSDMMRGLWEKTEIGQNFMGAHPGNSMWSVWKIYPHVPCSTIVSNPSVLYHPFIPRTLSSCEVIAAQSFPTDYDYGKEKIYYVCGMSVPPLMMQRISLEVGRQWFGVEYDHRRAPVEAA